MAGTMKGSLMKKLDMKGKTKPGEMISRMNDMKAGKYKKVMKKSIKKKDAGNMASYGKDMNSAYAATYGKVPTWNAYLKPSLNAKNATIPSTKMSMPSGTTANSTAKYKKMKKVMKKSIKTSGKFDGKSNKLGHGGRAAQLKAQGVPGGVIGNLARAAHAAPGQKNFHSNKAKKK